MQNWHKCIAGTTTASMPLCSPISLTCVAHWLDRNDPFKLQWSCEQGCNFFPCLRWTWQRAKYLFNYTMLSLFIIRLMQYFKIQLSKHSGIVFVCIFFMWITLRIQNFFTMYHGVRQHSSCTLWYGMNSLNLILTHWTPCIMDLCHHWFR